MFRSTSFSESQILTYKTFALLTEKTPGLHKGVPADVCCLNFNNALDLGGYRLTPLKLTAFCDGSRLLKCVTLNGRTFCTCFEEASSDSIVTSSGVIQASELGKLSFILFAKCLPITLQSTIIFADGMKAVL